MECNINKTGRLIRFVIGLVLGLIALGFLVSGSTWFFAFAVLALFFILEAAIGFCLLNKIMGKNSCEAKKPSQKSKKRK